MTRVIAKMPKKSLLNSKGQAEFVFEIEQEVFEDGLGMGVLKDGTPFLYQRALGELCGVRNKYIGIITHEWNDPNASDRTKAIRKILSENGEVPERAAYEAVFGSKRVLAYDDRVSTAILEYFAFDTNLSGKAIAQANFRKLNRYGLKQYIYKAVGYNTVDTKDDVWRIFHDRVGLTYDKVPKGYFSIFKEIASLIITLGLEGLHIDQNFVPDISVGQRWGKNWDTNLLGSIYGASANYAHEYPDYFKQAASNPQNARCYPEEALGAFRKWFRDEYVGGGMFKSYLSTKVQELNLSRDYIERAVLALTKDKA